MLKRVRGTLLLAAVAAAGLAVGFVTSGGATPVTADATTRVTVVAREFQFKLSKASVPTGTVIFTVVNKGKIGHNFKIAGKTTPMIKPGKSATLRVKISKKGRYNYLCTLPGHAANGMKGTLAVGTAATTTTVATTTTKPTTTTVITGPASTITVDMFEYRFQLSLSTVPSGPITFVITNRGMEPHNFDIAGVKAGAIIGPGQTETWTVGLAPKHYVYLCDVPFHQDRGMTGELIVT